MKCLYFEICPIGPSLGNNNRSPHFVLVKILEALVCDQIREFILPNNILSDY